MSPTPKQDNDGKERYQMYKVRNGLWRVVWEDGSSSEHSTQYGAEKAVLLRQPSLNEEKCTHTDDIICEKCLPKCTHEEVYIGNCVGCGAQKNNSFIVLYHGLHIETIFDNTAQQKEDQEEYDKERMKDIREIL